MIQTVNRQLQFKKFIPGIAWFFIVLGIMCTPGKEIPKVNWLENIDFDKVVHMGVFALMVVLFCWPFSKTDIPRDKKIGYYLVIMILVCLWGYATELIQKYFIEGRTYDITDWVSDGLGAIIGFFYCRKKFL